MIAVWNGREAHALREAMRMSIDEFAVHLGASRRGVARWSAAPGIRLRWDMQRALDRALAAAPAEARERLTGLLAGTGPVAAGRVSGRPMTTAGLSTALVLPPEPAAGEPLAMIQLERAVAQVRMDYQAGRYRRAMDRLPALLETLALARRMGRAAFPARVRALTSAVHGAAADLLLKMGDLPLAMLAAERAGQEAAAAGDELATAAATRVTARVLHSSGHQEQAITIATRAAKTLRQTVGLAGPRPLSGYGSLLLCAADASAGAGDRARAGDLLDQADHAAAKLGRDANFGWTAFGPANVVLHRIGAAVALGDWDRAVDLSGAVTDGVTPAERLASWQVDLAHAQWQLAQAPPALDSLRRAHRIAPDEVTMRPAARRLLTEIAQTASGPVGDRAASFAIEIG